MTFDPLPSFFAPTVSATHADLDDHYSLQRGFSAPLVVGQRQWLYHGTKACLDATGAQRSSDGGKRKWWSVVVGDMYHEPQMLRGLLFSSE